MKHLGKLPGNWENKLQVAMKLQDVYLIVFLPLYEFNCFDALTKYL